MSSPRSGGGRWSQSRAREPAGGIHLKNKPPGEIGSRRLKTVYTVCIIVFLLRALPAFGATDSERTVQVLSSDPAEVRNWKPSFATLNDWVEKMTRPGFRVLYKANVKGHYVAVFRTE